MNNLKRSVLLLCFSTLAFFLSALDGSGSPDMMPSARVEHFQLANQTFADGVRLLHSQHVHLNLGFESVLKAKYSDPPPAEPRFNLNLDGKTIGQILDNLCEMDSRYAWSHDGSAINIYPKSTIGDPTYLLNRKIAKLELKNSTDPYQVLKYISQALGPPPEQLGYTHAGGNVLYSEPWTVTFQNLTVREIINRITAHLGPQGGWIFYGSRDVRWFNFHKEPLNPAEQK